MDQHLIWAFHYQIKHQCHYADLALKAIGEDQFWFGVQSLLTCAANISKMLWGQGGKLSKERAPLRITLGVGDNSPLRPTTMRNHYEHIDERLDEWWRDSKRRNFADENIGPAPVIAGIDDIDSFRAFDPRSGLLQFWGDTFDLRAVVNEIGRIHSAVDLVMKRG